LATGGTTYNWSSGCTIASCDVSTADTYTVTVTDDNACSETDEITLTINDLPDAKAGNDTAICQGSTLSLLARGGTIYNWSSGCTTASCNVSTADTYTVTVTDANACSQTDEVEVSITIVEANVNDVAFCEGSDATLTATGGDTYLWSNAGTTASITLSKPDTTETFVVTVTKNGCTDIDSAVATLLRTPVAVLGDSICLGDTASLTVLGGKSFVWSTGGTLQSISVSPIINTTYSVTATENTCTASGTGVIIVNSNPTVNAGDDIRKCKDNPANLSASPNDNQLHYSWTTTGNAVLTNEDQYNPSVLHLNPQGLSADDTIGFYVEVTNQSDCKAIDSVNIIFEYECKSRVYIHASDDNICQGDSIHLWAEVDTAKNKTVTSLTWSDPIMADDRLDTIRIAPATTIIYIVTVVDDVPSADIDSITITVNPLPIATIAGDTAICAEDELGLSASGASKFEWADNLGSSADISIEPTATNTYAVTVTDEQGCIDDTSITVTVNPLPAVDLPTIDETCATADAIRLPIGTPLDGSYSGIAVADTMFDPVVAGEGTFTIRYSYTDEHGCTNMDSNTVLVLSPPKSMLSDTTICEGDTASLYAGTTDREYSWSSGSTEAQLDVLTAGQFIVTITAAECELVDTAEVTVNPTPVINRPEDVKICVGEQTIISPTSTPSSSTYHFDFGMLSTSTDTMSGVVGTYTYADSGSYHVTISTSVDGCYAEETFTDLASINTLPQVDFAYSPKEPSNLDAEVDFVGNSLSTIEEWTWSIGHNSIKTNGQEISEVLTTPGTYLVTLNVTDENNCTGTFMDEVYVKAEHTVYIPNAFSPNDDGLNDILKPVGIGINSIDFYVYSRWGEMIYHGTSVEEGWDGTKQGHKVPTGVYSWVVQYKDLDGEQFKLKGLVQVVE